MTTLFSSDEEDVPKGVERRGLESPAFLGFKQGIGEIVFRIYIGRIQLQFGNRLCGTAEMNTLRLSRLDYFPDVGKICADEGGGPSGFTDNTTRTPSLQELASA